MLSKVAGSLAPLGVWLAAGLAASADIVIDANQGMLAAIKADDDPAPLAARNLAILHAAIYDAYNAVARIGAPYYAVVAAPPGASAEAAAAAAAQQVSTSLYPNRSTAFAATYTAQLTAIPAGPGRDAGVSVGLAAANQILAWRESDNASLSVPYVPGTAPGEWQRTPPFFRPPDLPQWPYVTPFAMTNGSQFRPPGPPLLPSEEWADVYNLTKTIGATNSTVRTAAQSQIAVFWSDFSYTVTPPGHWNKIAATVATTMGNSLADNVRLFALLNLAQADAGIVAWDAKYWYNWWRPVTAIQAGDTDGNDLTAPDPGWNSFLVTPAFPEYPSGHSTFSAAAATVLARFYGTDAVGFSTGSDALPTVFRSFQGFNETAEECGISRIYGGIHFLNSDLDGLAAGRTLGAYVYDRLLVPNVAPAALLGPVFSGNQAQIQVIGTAGRLYILAASSDLRTWLPVATNAAPFTYAEPAGPAAASRFFRASPGPD